MLFSYPLMAGIQEISARIGRVTGHGLAANIGRHQSKPVQLIHPVISLMVFANVFNLGADIGAMGAAAGLCWCPGPGLAVRHAVWSRVITPSGVLIP